MKAYYLSAFLYGHLIGKAVNIALKHRDYVIGALLHPQVSLKTSEGTFDGIVIYNISDLKDVSS